jgi:uncharacterized protein with ACT and thioredoxin-like domain
MQEEMSKKMQSPERYEHISKTQVLVERENDVWDQYLSELKKVIATKMKNCPHKILADWSRHHIFTGHYFYYVNFKTAKDAERLGKQMKGYADVYTLEEHCKLMLDVYNKKIVNMNKFL